MQRGSAFVALWRVWRRSRRPDSPDLGEMLRAAPRMLLARAQGRYVDLPVGRAAAIGGALAYLISPIDVVPEGLLSVIGLIDDAAVATWLVGALLDETSRYLEWERAHATDAPTVSPA